MFLVKAHLPVNESFGESYFCLQDEVTLNTRKSVSLGYSNTEMWVEQRGASSTSRCLGYLMKHS